MIQGWQPGGRIVRSWAGQGTAETIYETEDGTEWQSNPTMPTHQVDSTTIQRTGRIVNGYIVGHTR